jgi:NAD(P) transhydrogenase subunit alpha
MGIMTKIFVVKEQTGGESRVGATPETTKRLAAAGIEVVVQRGAGDLSSMPEASYLEAGATSTAEAGASGPAIYLSLGAPSEETLQSIAAGSVWIGMLDPYNNTSLVRELGERGVTALSMELVPRITRAQSMDALSSQASIAGYKAVLVAATRLDRYFPLMMTAAGTIPPARVVVMGGGVAGLQALATAKRLGAVVEVSDIRPDVEEQVHSLGGRFIELPEMETAEDEGGYAKEMGEDFLRRQREIVKRHLAAADVVICTAQIPGKKAPLLITRDMAEGMRPGAVIIDLAAPQGGNCELTRLEEDVVHNGILIIGPGNLPATMAHDASLLYARNVESLLGEILVEGEVAIDLENEVLAGCVLTHGGSIVHPKFTHLDQEVNT